MANALTFFRMLLIPVIFFLVYKGETLAAAALFGAAALTDLFDGMVARRTGSVTEFGKIIDPLTDRLLIIFSILALYLRDALPPFWALSVLILRDFLMLLGFFYLRRRGVKLEVSMTGKVATTILMVSFVLLILGITVAVYLFYLGLITYLAAGFSYVLQGKERLETSI